MGAISWRLGVGLIASKLASTWASAWRRNELARDPGVELRLNQVTVMAASLCGGAKDMPS